MYTRPEVTMYRILAINLVQTRAARQLIINVRSRVIQLNFLLPRYIYDARTRFWDNLHFFASNTHFTNLLLDLRTTLKIK